MKLFVGLGNPGAKYEKTRHNIGFMAIDAIAEAHGFPGARSKFQGQFAEGRLGRERVMMLKPQTFMNLSGRSVGEAMRYYKLAPEDIVVFHDELDLAPAKVKVKTGGGHAGHNGLRSLHEHIGAEHQRVRLGVGHPGDKRVVATYVLRDFAQADQEWLAPLLEGVADGAPLLAEGDAGGFMNKIALKTKPPKSAVSKSAVSKSAASKSAVENNKPPKFGAEPAPPGTKEAPPKSALARLMAHFSRK